MIEESGSPSATGRGRGPLAIEGTYNLRDTGGYRAGDRLTRWGTLYRSDALHRLSGQGREALGALGIGTIVDLREDTERLHQPSLTDELGIETVHRPIFPDARGVLRPGWDLVALYRWVADEYPGNLASAVNAVARADAERAVLVHCTAGKDRTGSVIALALTAVGVDRDDVLDDYARTESNLAGAWLERHLAGLAEAGVEATPELVALVGSSPVEAISAAMEHIDARYGSAVDFLLANGTSREDLARLEQRLLD